MSDIDRMRIAGVSKLELLGYEWRQGAWHKPKPEVRDCLERTIDVLRSLQFLMVTTTHGTAQVAAILFKTEDEFRAFERGIDASRSMPMYGPGNIYRPSGRTMQINGITFTYGNQVGG